MRVYLDNAATSFPKPSSVANALCNYMLNVGSNPGRGGSSNVLEGDRTIFKCREALRELFNFDKTENVIFTNNITTSLNILLKSIVKDGWHVITSSMEHNSVVRPLETLKLTKNIEVDFVQCDKNGSIHIEDFKKCIKSNTKLVVLSHASNVIGTIQPLKDIGKICRDNDIYFIIDSAQSAGVVDVDFKSLNCNAIAFTGHKSLLGPQGTGGFLIDDSLNSEASTFIEGGTGSLSESIFQPDFLPDKFESGTMNAAGIAGLLEGILFIKSEGLCSIREKEEFLTQKFVDEAMNIPSIDVYGYKDCSLRTSAVSLNSSIMNNSELSYILDSEYGISTRSGLHCAPLAHKTMGTFPQGTIRFSFGYFNDEKDVDYALNCLNKILKRL